MTAAIERAKEAYVLSLIVICKFGQNCFRLFVPMSLFWQKERKTWL